MSLPASAAAVGRGMANAPHPHLSLGSATLLEKQEGSGQVWTGMYLYRKIVVSLGEQIFSVTEDQW